MVVFNLFWEKGINKNYIKVINDIYDNNTVIILLHKDTDKIKTGKEVKQGEMI